MNCIEQATRILRKPIGWIELDLTIDLEVWKKESQSIREHLVEHREGEGHSNWRSCCLHGLGIDITSTNDSAPMDHYHWTKLTKLCPTITAFWKSFPTERFARLRFMELGAGGFIDPHCDAPNGVRNTDIDMMDYIIPINVAIAHPTECYMELEQYGRVPWSEGKMFVVNITDTHSVSNPSTQPRMHMIAHCVVGNKKTEFSELIVRSHGKN